MILNLGPTLYERDEITAIDKEGNPVHCIGCGLSIIGWAAMHNSGDRRKCLCPTPEWGVDDPEFYSVALDRINRAVRSLETIAHHGACACPMCDALRTLRGIDS